MTRHTDTVVVVVSMLSYLAGFVMGIGAGWVISLRGRLRDERSL
jgi:hypothetical protein